MLKASTPKAQELDTPKAQEPQTPLGKQRNFACLNLVEAVASGSAPTAYCDSEEDQDLPAAAPVLERKTSSLRRNDRGFSDLTKLVAHTRSNSTDEVTLRPDMIALGRRRNGHFRNLSSLDLNNNLNSVLDLMTPHRQNTPTPKSGR